VPAELIGFLGVAVLVIVIPGPDTALTIRNTLLGGRAGGIATAFGVVGGQAVWALATSLGVVALLLASEPAFAAVRLAGAAYLVYLGGQTLVAAWRGGAWEVVVGRDTPPLAPPIAACPGLVNNPGNPKLARLGWWVSPGVGLGGPRPGGPVRHACRSSPEQMGPARWPAGPRSSNTTDDGEWT